jgi:hypothetical protein
MSLQTISIIEAGSISVEGLPMNSYEQGHRYEQQVFRWLQQDLSELHPEGRTNALARGLASSYPYEVDVSLTINNGGIPRQYHRTWVECRNRTRGSIVKDEVQQLVHKAQDTVRFARKMGVWHYDTLMFVSNRPFHADAASVATEEGVACYVFSRNKMAHSLGAEHPSDSPRWLKHC